jgi:amylosucrase
MADLRGTRGDLRERGIALCVDLVLNHTAREHEWARKAVAGEPLYREMYLIYRTAPSPTPTSGRCRRSFPDTAPGSFTEVPGLGWVWPPFHDYQWI